MSSQVLERLVVEIDGESGRLRDDLRRSGVDVQAFASNVDRRLATLSTGVTRSITTMRRTLGAFGVLAGARMFSNFIEDAVKVAELTEEQRKAVDAAAASWRALGKEIKQAAAERAAAMSGYSGAVADEIRKSFFPDGDKTVAGLKAELERLYSNVLPNQLRERQDVDFLERLLGMDEAEWSRRIATTLADIDKIEEQIAALETASAQNASMRQAMAGMGRIGDVYDRFGSVRGALDGKTLQRPAANVDWLPDADGLEEIVVDAKRLSVDDLMNDMPDFRKLFEPLKREATLFHESLGRGLHDSFVDAMLGMEVNFKDLLKRLAAEWAASQIFTGLTTALAGGGGTASFFSKIFGGARADGGPVSAGRAYLVGERGPEIFAPDISGRILNNASLRNGGRGGGVSIGHVSVDARGATDPAAVASAAHQAVLQAVSIANAHTDAKLSALYRPSHA